MAVQLVARGKPIREQVSAAEWSARVELAAGHRVLAHYGINDLTYNHFGLRVPGEPDHVLIKRTDWMFSEITASSLLKVDFDGNVLTDTDVKTIKGGALIIHAGLLKARADLNATLHTHTVSGMGVAAHKFGLLPINQHAIRFYGEVKYHEFEGFEFDDDMTPKLIRDLGGGFFMILRSHGVLVCGESVAECVVNHHFLEMACQGQIAALAAGEGNYTIPSKEACEYAHSQFMDAGNFLTGGKEWAACLGLAERLDPSLKQYPPKILRPPPPGCDARPLRLCRVSPPGEVARALRPAPFAVAAARFHRKGIAAPVGALAALDHDRHRAFDDEEARVEFVRVFRVKCIRRHPAIHNFRVALPVQFGLECRALHLLSP